MKYELKSMRSWAGPIVGRSHVAVCGHGDPMPATPTN